MGGKQNINYAGGGTHPPPPPAKAQIRHCWKPCLLCGKKVLSGMVIDMVWSADHVLDQGGAAHSREPARRDLNFKLENNA